MKQSHLTSVGSKLKTVLEARHTNIWPFLCALGIALASVARAETNLAVSAFSNGEITITNMNADMFYTVAWSSDLTETNGWSTTWTQLQDMQPTGDTIVAAVPMFYRVHGSSNRTVFAGVPTKTGQTNSYETGDDGDLERGIALPSPRFTDNGDGTVTDNLTGLIWLKNANYIYTDYPDFGTSYPPNNGRVRWLPALDFVSGMNVGTYGNFGHTDWRLPNVHELHSLIDYGRYGSALPEGHPFTDVQSDYYWSSSTAKGNTSYAWTVYIGDGTLGGKGKHENVRVWPVRGGHQ